MTEETNATQGAEQSETVQQPAIENAQESGNEQTADQQQDNAEESGDGKDPAKAEPKKTPWFQTRINQVTAEKHEAIRRAEAAEARLREEKPITDESGKSYTQADIDRLAEQKANLREFNRKCDAVYDAGKSEYSDFDDAVKTLGTAGVMHGDFLETVTDSPESHKLIYHLGQNPEEALRIAQLPPTKQAREIVRLEASLSKPAAQKPISKAAAPIRPIDGKSSGGGGSSRYDPNMSMKDYVIWSDNQKSR